MKRVFVFALILVVNMFFAVDMSAEVTCARPIALDVDALSMTGARLNWQLSEEGDTTSKFIINFYEVATGEKLVCDTFVSKDMCYSVSNLKPATRYSFNVMSHCQDFLRGFSDVSETFVFNTLYAPLSLPYSEGFDNEGSGIPAGWLTDYNNPSSVTSSIYYGNAGKSLALSASSNVETYVVLPQIVPDTDTDTLQLSMMVWGLFGTRYFVGVLSDPSDMSTFFPLVSDTLSVGGVWERIVVDIPVEQFVVEPNWSLAIAVPEGVERTLYVDDVSVVRKVKDDDVGNENPDTVVCDMPSLHNVVIDADNFVTITINSDVDSVEIRITESPISSDVFFADTVVTSGYRKQFFVDNLKANTEYFFSVRAICDYAHVSGWTDTSSFKTYCNVYDLPYAEPFENSGTFDCWSIIRTSASTAYLSDLRRYTGDKSLFACNVHLISPELNVESLAGKTMSCYVYSASNDTMSLDFGVQTDPSDITYFEPYIDTVIPPTNGWREITITFDSLFFVGNSHCADARHVAIVVPNGMMFYIDNVRVHDVPACPMPLSMSVTDIAEHSCVVSFEPSDDIDVSSWVVRFESENETLYFPTSTTSLLVEGLDAATTYGVGVAAVCAPGDTSLFTIALNVTTQCEAIAEYPFVESFEGLDFPSMCWSEVRTYGSKGDWVRSSENFCLGSASAELIDAYVGNRTNLITPKMTFADTTYKVSYWQYRNFFESPGGRYNPDGEGVAVWVNSAPDTDGAVKLGFVHTATSYSPAVDFDGWYQYEYLIPDSLVGDYYIIFEGINQNCQSTYIDGIEVSVYKEPENDTLPDNPNDTVPVIECKPDTVETLFFEGFETYNELDYETSELGCWDNMATTIYDPSWKATITPDSIYRLYAHTGDGYAYMSYNSTVAIEREFYLPNAGSYKVSLFVKNPAGGGMSLRIYLRNGEEEIDLYNEPVDNVEYVEINAPFVIAVPDVYVIGIEGVADMSADYAVIDDITIARVSNAVPGVVRVDSVSDVAVRLSWEAASSAEKYNVQILNAVSGDVLVDSILVATSCLYEELLPATDYRARVRGINASDTSTWSSVLFTTDCAHIVSLPVYYNFNGGDDVIPQCWSLIDFDAESDYGNWRFNTDGKNSYIRASQGELAAHSRLKSETYHISDTTFRLLFDYIHTDENAPLEVFLYVDDNSIEPVSLKMTPADTLWHNFSFSLAPYNGKDVFVVFVANPDETPYWRVLNYQCGIDNFAILCEGDSVVVKDTVCVNEPYVFNDFDIRASELKSAGDYVFRRIIYPKEIGDCAYDKILHLHVLSGGEEHVYDTVCRGDEYEFGGLSLTKEGTYFDYIITESGCQMVRELHLAVIEIAVAVFDTICEGDSILFGGEYRKSGGIYTHIAPNRLGCDSTTTLFLFEIPKLTEETIYVCEGGSKQWQDTLLTSEGRYIRNYVSSHGCDSSFAVNVIVVPTVFEISATICRGNDYLLGNRSLTASGYYVDTLVNHLGCDSIIKLNLTVTSPDTLFFYDEICENVPYYGHGLNGVLISSDTVVYTLGRTAEGCDSVSVTYITFHPAAATDTVVTILDGESFDFGSNTLTIAGVYVDTFATVYGCDSVVTLNLDVVNSVDNIHANTFVLVPNPVKANGVVYIHTERFAVDVEAIMVELLNSAGQVINRFEPTAQPIAIQAPSVSGIYYIRLTDASGDVYIDKLIVQ